MLTDINQELMTPHEAARWFRRSPSWLRQQAELLRVGGPNGQPLYHVRVCRAYILGRMCSLAGDDLRRIQVQALESACGVAVGQPAAQTPDEPAAAADEDGGQCVSPSRALTGAAS